VALWASLASTAAVTVGILTFVAGFCESKRRQLDEVIDLIVRVQDFVAWGGSSLPTQERLRIKAAHFDLPKAHELADAHVLSDERSAQLADEALQEALAARDRIKLISACGRLGQATHLRRGGGGR
jgi:hypothetical protein